MAYSSKNTKSDKSNFNCKDNNQALIIPNTLQTTLLSPENKEALKRIDVEINNKVTNSCQVNNVGPANQIFFGTFWCDQLATLESYGITKDDIEELIKRYYILFPWSMQYAKEKTNHNERQVYFPLFLIYPRNSKEVSKFINFCRDTGLTVSIRSGGHCWLPFSIENQVIIDTTLLELSECGQIKIDKKKNLMKVLGGVRQGVIYEKLAEFGYMIPGGTCPTVTLFGIILGLGVNVFIRKFGFTCDSVKSLEIIIADGSLIKASKKHNNDLYRALKGGGNGSFGVVTSLTMNIYPIKRVIYAEISFNTVDAFAVLTAWFELCRTGPDNFAGSLINIPGGLDVFLISFVFLEDSDVQALLQPILDSAPVISYSQEEMSVLELDSLEALLTPRFPFVEIGSNFIPNALSKQATTEIFNAIAAPPTSDPTKGVAAIQLLSLGGKVSRVPPEASVATIAARQSVAWIQAASFWSDQSIDAQMISYAQNLMRIIRKFVPLIAFPNYPEIGLTPVDYYKENLPFLEKVKAKYDPNDFFHFSQSIPLPSHS